MVNLSHSLALNGCKRAQQHYVSTEESRQSPCGDQLASVSQQSHGIGISIYKDNNVIYIILYIGYRYNIVSRIYIRLLTRGTSLEAKQQSPVRQYQDLGNFSTQGTSCDGQITCSLASTSTATPCALAR